MREGRPIARGTGGPKRSYGVRMVLCRSCGFGNAEGMRFCGDCGTRLDTAAARTRRERKVVTVLFCDLVGFTAASDGADPEEVQAALSPYHATARVVIERFGGTVEKFIGDAVMAAFGAPVVHEDDPERAVRAGLGLLTAVRELSSEHEIDLQVRIGVATGEAVVSTGARPERGEGMLAGDVVNTAARLQTAAPVGGVLVSRSTRDATRASIEYDAHDPVTVKGKAAPLEVWVARRPRGSAGEALTDASHPMIGRADELGVLQRVYTRAVRESSAQLVTVVAEPGLGKSRLVQAFFEVLDGREELVCWRQGRCRSYGDAVTFEALAQVVKAQTAILDTDTVPQATEKLADSVHELVLGTGLAPQESWLVARLAALVGLPALEAPREELFAAWRRFLEALAAVSPLVLVVEDLHWADPALLEFLDYLLDWVVDVPVTIIATARPELYDAAPGWGAGRAANSTTLRLSPLSDTETAQLVTGLLGTAVLPADVHGALLARAAGNPLYAREYVNMVTERAGESVRRGALATLSDALPGSVRAVIAARLDTLAPRSKSLLQAAAVVGYTFWTGAVTALTGDDPDDVAQQLHHLVRRDYLRPSRSSSIAGETEYSFSHALIADVALSQVPRATRVAHHRAAGDWHVGVTSGDDASAGSRRAAVIAHHYTQAHRLTTAVHGEQAIAAELAALAADWHGRAARRAQQVDLGAAESHTRAALGFGSADDRGRLELLIGLAGILTDAGRAGEADEVYSQAHETAQALGDPVAAALVDVHRSVCQQAFGRFGTAAELADRAVAVLERVQPARPELLDAYVASASLLTVEGLYLQARRRADQAMELAGRLPSPGPRMVARALHCRGISRVWSGDREGESDLTAALDLARRHDLTAGLITTLSGIGLFKLLTQSPGAAIPFCEQAVTLARDRGHRGALLFNTGNLAEALALAGRLDDALDVCEHAGSELADTDSPRQAMALQLYWSWVLTLRGAFERATALIDSALPVARGAEPSALVEALLVAVDCARGRGDRDAATALIDELVRVLDDPEADADLGQDVRLLARLLAPAGYGPLVERIVGHIPSGITLYDNNILAARAALAEADGDHTVALRLHERAAMAWSSYACPVEEAQALLGVARCCLAMGRQASEPLAAARALLSGLKAGPLLAEADAILGRSTALNH
jgi:class 3 adenylate cyclase/tetratricopeptide (TPR) repeat protein